MAISIGVTTRYFNPRTREGCDHVVLPVVLDLFEISIHAPVKGATTRKKTRTTKKTIFQSTHP